MRIAIACDHAGFPLKDTVIAIVTKTGHIPIDVGTNSIDQVDFPDFTEKAGRLIQEGKADRAIIICGSGIGACIAANKMRGIYASVCHDTYSAHQGVEHDNMNVLCLGGRVIGPDLIEELVQAFLSAHFLKEERYCRRIEKIRNLEKNF